MNVNDKVSINLCCGCGACADICPVNAIDLNCNSPLWHLYPEINDKCINCGKCISVCPQLKAKPENNPSPSGYAVVAEDEVRKESSSGGVFYILADKIIQKGGYVAGAVFDENFVVKHIITDSIEGVKRMQHSKYVQSNASGIYKSSEQILKDGGLLLFTGTPCQVAALKSYLGKDYPNLITVDILCHGTPSPRVFEQYLNENFDKSQIKDIIFRNKNHRKGATTCITFVMKSGEELYSEYFDNSYTDAFFHDIAGRPICFECKYAEFPRVGEISMGDFWGAKNAETAIDYQNGISCVFVNNPKGEELWKEVENQFKTVEKQHSNKTLMSWNRNKVKLSHNQNYRQLPRFIKKYNSLSSAVDVIKNDKYEVGVFGVVMNPNYGGLITYYALYETISSMGYRTVLINKPTYNKDSKAVTHSTIFFNKYCNVTKQYTPDELSKLNANIDTFVLGSDQVWNYRLFHCWYNNLYFDFVDFDKKKIAYAASFGLDRHVPDADRVGQVSALFKEFDYIGVRENKGVDILKKNYGVVSDCVLDPVFLLNKEKYIQIAEKASVAKKTKVKPYIGCYIIEPANEYRVEVVKAVCKYKQMEPIIITDGNMSVFDKKNEFLKKHGLAAEKNATIEDWLNIIINADFVITDSFHASSFCIIFNKPFIVLQERWALSRLQTLMDTFSLHNRWLKISDISEFSISDEWFEPLPDSVGETLQELKQKNRLWLRNSIEGSKTIEKYSAFEPLFAKDRAEDYFFFLLKNRKDYVLIVSSGNFDGNIYSKIDFKCKLSYLDLNEYTGKAFALIYDFSKGKLQFRGGKTAGIAYNTGDKEIRCLADNNYEGINNIYVSGSPRRVAKLDTKAGVTVSIYSKTKGTILDSFKVYLDDNIAKIKRQ
ncbi:MAG: polysaccharide pyruvyl transferase family protein [Clostridia bacterium]|nr:polysaccharide pyruvyl transferase family protein [Clostridia bacterium]